MSEKTFYLFRHGQTDWNKERRFQGHSNIPLNDLGRRQAATLVNVFKNLDIKRVISSDLDRARSTAQVLIDHYGYDLHIDQRLRETNMGEIEGKNGDDVARLVGPDAIKVWKSHDPKTFDFRFPKGESKNDVRKRAFESLIEYAEKYPDENLAISAHGGVLRLLLTLTKNTPDSFIYIKNCGVYELHFNEKEDLWRSSFENLNKDVEKLD